jgi:hypothetical protein
MAGPRYVMMLEAAGAGAPAPVRLRRWLKTALRGFGLRAVRVEQLQDGPADAAHVAQEGRTPAGEADVPQPTAPTREASRQRPLRGRARAGDRTAPAQHA